MFSPERVKFPLPYMYKLTPTTLVELRMRQLSGIIRSKPNWWEKVNDASIVAKWRKEMIEQDEELVDRYWSGEDRFEEGDGEKQWPREKITSAQLDYIFEGLKYDGAQRDPDTGAFVTSIHNVYESRSLIPSDLKTEFVKGVSLLEDVPEEEKDWHPGTNKQVLDLVHPSMYCLYIGESYARKRGAPDDAVELLTKEAYKERRTDLERVYEEWAISEKYQWLPTDFQVSESGDVKTLSYINNLHPTRHRALYSPVASILSRFVPLFNRILSGMLSGEPPVVIDVNPNGWYEKLPPDELYEDDDALEEWERVEKWPTIPDPPPFSPPSVEGRKEYSLHGRKIQVIVKLANIILTPENPKYPGGSWHIEGMANESIVATGIYYYACENITESRLEFRAVVADSEAALNLPYEQGDHRGYVVAYGFGRDNEVNQKLGRIVAEEDKCVAFPNVYQHRVDGFELADPTKPGFRKILCFFLVDPEVEILATTNVPPQQEDWSLDELDKAPGSLKKLPPELFNMVVGHVKEGVVSRQKAEEHRELLMKERSAFVAEHNEQVYEVVFNMCEH